MQKQQHCTAHAAVEAWRSLAAAAAAVEAGAAAGRGGCLGCGAQCCAVLDSPSCRSCGSPAGTAPGRHPAPAAREARQAGRQQRVGGRRRCGCQRDGGKGRAQMHWACAAPAQTGAATTNQPPPTASTPPGTAPRCTHPPIRHPPGSGSPPGLCPPRCQPATSGGPAQGGQAGRAHQPQRQASAGAGRALCSRLWRPTDPAVPVHCHTPLPTALAPRAHHPRGATHPPTHPPTMNIALARGRSCWRARRKRRR